MRKPNPADAFYLVDLTQMLAANIDAAMTRRHMTEPELSKASGVSLRTVGNFVRPANRRTQRNQASYPSGTIANLMRLARALGMEPWELLMPEPQRRYHVAIEEAFVAREVKRKR